MSKSIWSNRISIHAPRAGSDPWRAVLEDYETISIHAPRAGSDLRRNISYEYLTDFNPRSPCGERLNNDAVITIVNSGFQSTLPVRGATK